MNNTCTVHLSKITVLSFVCNSHGYLFHQQNFHMCNIHPYEHVDFSFGIFWNFKISFWHCSKYKVPMYPSTKVTFRSTSYLYIWVQILTMLNKMLHRHNIIYLQYACFNLDPNYRTIHPAFRTIFTICRKRTCSQPSSMSMSLYELEEVNHICATLYEATHMTLLVKYILDYEV